MSTHAKQAVRNSEHIMSASFACVHFVLCAEKCELAIHDRNSADEEKY